MSDPAYDVNLEALNPFAVWTKPFHYMDKNDVHYEENCYSIYEECCDIGLMFQETAESKIRWGGGGWKRNNILYLQGWNIALMTKF
jgi:hypothetical protein